MKNLLPHPFARTIKNGALIKCLVLAMLLLQVCANSAAAFRPPVKPSANNTFAAAVVSSVAVPAAGTYVAGQQLTFTVDYGVPITVTGAPYIGVTLNTGGTVHAVFSSTSGNLVIFKYTIASGNADNNGIGLATSITASGGTLKDGSGVSANLTLHGAGATTAILVDAVKPTVSSINIAGSSPTNAASLDYTVTFSENVTGVDVNDFALTYTGNVNGTVFNVSGSNKTYTVTVNSITGDGSMRLDLNSTATGIADVPGNAIATGYTAGQTYTLSHLPPPSVSYGGAKVYAPGTAIGTLMPTSSNVDALAYNAKVAIATSTATANTPQMISPNAIAVDNSGNIYVLNNDITLKQVVRIPTGLAGYGPNFSSAYNMTTDAAGNIYVADISSTSITKITPDNTTTTIGTFSGPSGVAFDGAGNMYVTELYNNDVVKVAAGSGTQTVVASGFAIIYDVAVDAAGNLLILDTNTGIVYKLPAGATSTDPSTLTQLITGLTNATTLAIDPSGNIFVSNNDKFIVELSNTGVKTNLATGLNAIWGVATDGKGNVFAADNGGSKVYQVKPSGGYFISPALPAGLSFNNSTGAISGTPTTLTPAADYTVTAYNALGSSSATVNIRIAAVSGNANLSGLSASVGALSPAFDEAVFSYSTTAVPYATASADITPTLEDNTAAITINGSPAVNSAANTVALVTGPNTVAVKVTAADGVTNNTYNIAITRAAQPVINVTGTIAAMQADAGYTGGIGSVKQFRVSGSNLTAAITIAPPPGFEISQSSSSGFGTGNITLTPLSGTVADTWIYVRLALADTAGDYLGSIVLSSTDADVVNITIPTSTVAVPPAVLVDTDPANTHDAGCYGSLTGKATVIVSGGFPAYSYSWSPLGGTGSTASNLPAGTYVCTITDNTGYSVASANIVIGQPDELAATTTQNNATTYGGSDGSATVNVTGGTPDYSYSWSLGGATGNSISGLTAGDYTVTVTDAHGCSVQKTVTITAPAGITSVSVPANGTYAPNSPLAFTAHFSDVLTVSTTGGTPYLNIDIGGSARQAAYVSGTGSADLLFSYTIAAGDFDADGIAVDGITLNSGDIKDNSAANADLTLHNLPLTTGILVDGVAPTVSSVTATTPGNAAVTNAAGVDYTIVFSEAVTGVAASAFSLTTSGTSGSVAGITGAGTTYVVTVNNITGTGTLRLDLNNTGTGITDAAGNEVSGGFTSGDVYNIDRDTPTVLSIAPAGAGSTNVASVDFTVTFSEAVTGVDMADFDVANSGTTGIVSAISGSGATYTVTVNGVSGNGSLGLSLKSSATAIIDVAGNTISGGFTGGAYTIDNTAPNAYAATFTSNNADPGIAKTGDIVTLSFTTNEPVQIPAITIAGHSVTANNLGGNVWSASYTVATGDADGPQPFTLDLYDIAGNHKNYNSGSTSLYFPFDQTKPTVAVSNPTLAITGSGTANTVSFDVTYGDANFKSSNLTPGDITLNRGGTANAVVGLSGSGTSYTVTLSGITGFGTLGITIAAGTVLDKPGNTNDASGPSAIVNVVSADATLSGLTTALRKVAPVFKPSVTTGYTTFIPFTATSTTITATANEPNATMQVSVNGGSYVPVTSGTPSPDLALNPGPNTINVLVTAQDGVTTKTYTVTTTRQYSYFLTSLNFSPNIIKTQVTGANYVDYTATVSSAVSVITVTPTAQDPTSTITVNGAPVNSGDASGPVTLNAGQNTITTTITTADNVSKTYSVVITRQGDALLSSLTYSPLITVVKTTGSADFNYKAAVPVTLTSITVTPVTNDPAATIKVNGGTVLSGHASGPVAVTGGQTIITTVVTAADGLSTKTYSTVLTRPANALLATLTYSPPSLKKTKVNGSNYVDYVATVDQSVTATTVTPVAQDPTSTITVNGTPVISGHPSGNIALSAGATTVNTVVTASDGVTTNTYSIVITRTASALLSSLTYSPALTVSKVTGSHDFDYTARMSGSSVQVMPVTADAAATVTVNGIAVTSGNLSAPVALNIGDNVINTKVTAADGITTKTYSITITRLPNALLATLTYNPLSIRKVKVTGSNYVDYTAVVKNNITEVTVTPVTQDPTSTVMVNGQTVASGGTSDPVSLMVGDNTVNTVVTAADGTTTNTYSMVITRQGPAAAYVAYDAAKDLPMEPAEVLVHQNVSPNGDGRGDAMQIDGITAYPDNKLQIMSRSGALVYEIKGYNNATKVFDGHGTDGKLQKAGTYFYSLEYKNGSEMKRKTGFIVLKY